MKAPHLVTIALLRLVPCLSIRDNETAAAAAEDEEEGPLGRKEDGIGIVSKMEWIGDRR